MDEGKPKSQAYELLEQQKTLMIHGCEVCYRQFTHDVLIAVENISYRTYKRVFPWFVCKECAQNISNALKAKEGKNEKNEH